MNNQTRIRVAPVRTDILTEDRAKELVAKSNRLNLWSRVGTDITEPMTVLNAFNSNGLDYVVTKEPLYRAGDDGKMIHVPNRVALVNNQTHETLDVVSSDYEVIDNRNLARYLEPMQAWGRIANVGRTGNGKEVFAVFEAGEFEVLPKGRSDILKFFAIVRDGKGNGVGLTLQIVPVRLMCVNGMISASYGSAITAAIKHTNGANLLAEWVGVAMGRLGQIEQGVRSRFQSLATLAITDGKAQQTFDAAYPTPKPPRTLERLEALQAAQKIDGAGKEMLEKESKKYDEAVVLAADRREMCMMAWNTEIADEGIQGTAWGAWNAVTAVAGHRKEDMRTAKSALFGADAAASIRAYEFVMSLN